MMKRYWENFMGKVNSMSLRERALTFAAFAFILIALAKSTFLDPLQAEQKKLSIQIKQQQEKMKAIQAQAEALQQARMNDANSPERQRLEQLKRQLADGNVYLQSLRDHMVAPEEMAGLLEQMLNQNGRLQLINLQTLQAAPLIAKPWVSTAPPSAAMAQGKQMFKHGVRIIVRGSYMDLLQYLTAIEQLPTKMFWGKVEMKVEKHPEIVLTLTLYTLSMDKTWLQI